MLSSCSNCDFYLQPLDLACPNCGLDAEKAKSGERFQLWKFAARALVAAIITAIFLRFWLTPPENSWINVGYQASLLGVATAIMIEFVSHIYKAIYTPSFFRSESLLARESAADDKIDALKARKGELKKVLEQISEADGDALQEVRRKLLAASELVDSQTVLFELQVRRIRLARLQNQLTPLLSISPNLSNGASARSLTDVDKLTKKLGRIRRGVTDNPEFSFTERTEPLRLDFVEILDETEKSCRKIREAIISLQAARALQGISASETSLPAVVTTELQTSTTFNANAEITDFADAFDELEREYQRLMSENELSQPTRAEQNG